MIYPVDTLRLTLRAWKPEDLEPFARMNADPRVMEFFPACLSREESDGLARRIQDAMRSQGFAQLAMELKSTREFMGFVGLSVPNFNAYFTPSVEIGWRIAAEYWNKGYATEGARAVLKQAFNILGLQEIVSFTTLPNLRSVRVMEKIGMHRDGEFDHPGLPEDHPFRRHVVYRLTRADWAAASR
jgi:RimJ/RimL family protein N-acetyltransferase